MDTSRRPRWHPNRRRNLKVLIKLTGGTSVLAERLGYKAPSFLSQMAGPHPTREVSSRTARLIEAELGLARGWLDLEADAARRSLETPRQVREAVRELRVTFSPDDFAAVVAFVSTYAQAESRRKFVADLLPLVARTS